MNTTKYLSLAALALMGTLASCQSDDEATIARPANAVGINVTVGSLQTTRSNPASTDYEEAHYFNLDDQVCVSTEGQDPVIFKCTNATDQTWAEAEAGKFLLWKQSEMTFKAYYPVTEGTSMTNFTLPAEQSTEANIALADYMTREQMRTSDDGNNINLLLWRKTARVIVKIAGFGGQYSAEQQTVSNVLINSQFSAIADGDGTGDITAVTPYAQNGTGGVNTTYTALVVPGDGDSGATFITLTDALNNTLTVKGIPELREGYSYTYNLTVGKNTIQVQSVTVQDWTDGAALDGGQAQEILAAEGHDLSASAVGEIVGTDGKAYAVADKDNLPEGVTAVAMVAYKSETTGSSLAIALADEANKMDWSTANSTCEGKTAIGGNSWKLPSQEEWKQMFKANGGDEDSYIGLNDALAAAGGDSSKLQEFVNYWSSSEVGDEIRCVSFINDHANWGSGGKDFEFWVRACFAF